MVLGSFVASAFPVGVQHGSPVAVRNSSAIVDFSANAATTKPQVRGQMLRQLQQSLLATNITFVAMTARGAPLAFPDSQDSHAQPAAPLSSAPLLQKGTQFGFFPDFGSLGGISTQVAKLNGTAAVLDHAQTTGAVLAHAGVYLVTGAAAQLVDSRPGLISPSIDTFGYVWSVPSTDATAIRATRADGIVHSISSMIPPGATVVSLNVSRDGARVLLYLATRAGPRLVVAGVVRRAGVPTSLGELLDLPVSSARPIDATWVDLSTVAALGSNGGEDTVTSYVVGGSPGDSSRTDGGIRLVGGGDSSSLRLLTGSGDVQQLRASGWQDIGVLVSLLATQQ